MPTTVRRWLAKLVKNLILKHEPSPGVGLLLSVIRYCRNTGTCCVNIFGGGSGEFSRGLMWIERSAEECYHVVN